MKKFKLFFALFAMLALNVGNAWGAEVTFDPASDKTFPKDGVTLSLTDGTLTNGTDYRVYKNQTMTISSANGTITNIALTYKSASYDGGGWASSYQPNADSWTSPTASGEQARITKIVVTYTPSAGGGEETAVSVPTFSVPECTFYSSSLDVELSCATDGATIHYTLDGSTPSSTSETYTSAIAISETTTVKAIAVKDGLTNSEVATATYTKGETVTSYDIDFEKNVLEAYVNWEFSNITIANTITAKGGTYYGNTSGNASASIKTKTAIQYPGILTFYTSKESGNTISSSWKVQVSPNGSNWTEVTSFDATTGDKGTWTERTADLSDCENVYVQISYAGSTAVRAIDEISLAQGVAPVTYTLTIEDPENGTLSVTKGGVPVASGEKFKATTSLVVTPTPNPGYLFESLTVDGTPVDLTEGSYNLTMPASDVTVAATFKANEKPDATLTLSKNGETEDITGYKQDDKVTLPSITSDCVKKFVGWSANANCVTEPEYKANDEYTLTSTTQTLYAVYADGEGGGTVTITPSAVSGSKDPYTFTIDATGYSLIAKKNNGSTAPTYNASDNDVRVYAQGTITLSAPNAMSTIIFNISTQGKKRLAPITASVGTIATQASGDATVTWTGDATEVTFTVGNTANFGSESTKAGQLCFSTLEVTHSSEYSNYSTTCVPAPKAGVNPTEITATATGVVEGKVTVTYERVNTEGVAVAIFNNEPFTADWLTASLDGDKNVTYTIAENTTYTERKAYIQLTAPETTGATEPAVVVIPVIQAGKDKVFASLEALLAAITPTTEGVEVTVTLTNEVIKDFNTSGSSKNGIALNVPYQGGVNGVKEIEIYCNNVPADWVKGGKVSGTITCPWKDYYGTWELCPTTWEGLTYTAPATVKSIAVSGTPTKITYIDGEAFDPTGLVVTATLTDDSTEPIDFALVDWTFDPATLSTGQTSVNVTATYNSVSSVAYEVTGLTVNDIPTKTIAEFIAAGGGRCYLEGIVSNIQNTQNGNFDLTDESGTIYVYGCLNGAGESKKFAELGVKNGDKIKVIADEYELYQTTKPEAKNVQYVSHISAATITIADITMEVDEVKNISATVEPAEAAEEEVTYTIKENTGNAISLSGNTITARAVGTAIITATVENGATYMGNSVDFTVTVGPKTEKTDVVILAELDGKWYAMKGAEGSGTGQLAAVEVTYFNGTLYNVEDKASITWTRSVVDGKATFVNKDNSKYLKGTSANTNLVLDDSKCEWTFNGTTYTIGSRTFLYRENYNFKNYTTDKADASDTQGNYSSLPVVTAAKFETAIEIGSGDNSTVIAENVGQTVNVIVDRAFEAGDEWYTLCVPFNMPASVIGTAYQLSGLIQKDADYVEVNLAPKTTIEAGQPYLVKPNVTVNKFVVENVTIVNTTGESIEQSISGLSVAMQGVINGTGTTGGLYWVGNSGYLYNDDVVKLGLRTYFNITTPSGIAPRMRVVAGENVETGVEDLFTTDAPVKVIENGQLIIIRDGVKYNVQGQKL